MLGDEAAFLELAFELQGMGTPVLVTVTGKMRKPNGVCVTYQGHPGHIVSDTLAALLTEGGKKLVGQQVLARVRKCTRDTLVFKLVDQPPPGVTATNEGDTTAGSRQEGAFWVRTLHLQRLGTPVRVTVTQELPNRVYVSYDGHPGQILSDTLAARLKEGGQELVGQQITAVISRVSQKRGILSFQYIHQPAVALPVLRVSTSSAPSSRGAPEPPRAVDAEGMFWDRARRLRHTRTPVLVTVAEEFSDGILVVYDRHEGYLNSGVDAAVRDLKVDGKELVGQELSVVISKVDQEESLLFFTYRPRVRDGLNPLSFSDNPDLQVGRVVTGRVQSVQPYGAFVRLALGGTGLLHVSQVTDSQEPFEVAKLFAVGQEVKAVVRSVDVGTGRVSLSTRHLEATPGDMLRDARQVFETAEWLRRQSLEDQTVFGR